MLDGNITEEAIDHACYFCTANHIPGTTLLRLSIEYDLMNSIYQ